MAEPVITPPADMTWWSAPGYLMAAQQMHVRLAQGLPPHRMAWHWLGWGAEGGIGSAKMVLWEALSRGSGGTEMPKGVGGKLARQFTRGRSQVPQGVRRLYGHPICSTAERVLRALERAKQREKDRARVRGRVAEAHPRRVKAG